LKNYWRDTIRVENTAPVILDACINYLKERPVNTKFHPKEGVYIIDTNLMARIIWHEKDLWEKVDPDEKRLAELNAQVTQDETRLCNHFIRALIDQKNVKSVMTYTKYIVLEKYDCQRKTMIVKKKKILNIHSERGEVIKSIDKKGVEAKNG
jgi:hypothetical protein